MDGLAKGIIGLFVCIVILFLVGGAFQNNASGLFPTVLGWALGVGIILGTLASLFDFVFRLIAERKIDWRETLESFMFLGFAGLVPGSMIGFVVWLFSSL